MGWAKIAAIVFIISTIGSGIWYIVDLNNDLSQALNEKEKLETVVENQKDLIESKEKDIRQIKSINSGLRKIVSKQKSEMRELNEKFNESSSGDERDLGEITLAKPGLVENIVNGATTDVNRCFELATGSPITEDDYDNSSCKDLVESLRKGVPDEK